MKTTKRILATLLAALMILGAFAIASSAAMIVDTSATDEFYRLRNAAAVAELDAAARRRELADILWCDEVLGGVASTTTEDTTTITDQESEIDMEWWWRLQMELDARERLLQANQGQNLMTLLDDNSAVSASESRIRDTDMAKEMISFTQDNVLQQAGTAMLAQANQAPQAVLQLLR